MTLREALIADLEIAERDMIDLLKRRGDAYASLKRDGEVVDVSSVTRLITILTDEIEDKSKFIVAVRTVLRRQV